MPAVSSSMSDREVIADVSRPLILVTNDDGISSPGILAAALAASRLGDVIVAAPTGEQTAMGRAYPKTPDTGRITEYRFPAEVPNLIGSYGVHGSPAQVVSYAVLEICNRMPDLCISGVNFGENLGTTLTGSGTVGAALEADSYDIPAVAISLQTGDGDAPDTVDWALSRTTTERIGGLVLRRELPEGIGILNVNIPKTPRPDVRMRRTIDSRQPFWVFQKPRRVPVDGWGDPAKLPVTSEIIAETLEADSDIHVLINDGDISVTPFARRLAFEGEWELSEA